ncbi:AAA-like domain-containing protein [Coleofasciculus sp. E2-BRE-01]|uniref:AAA-like domain-containing protein n=1 Tax=Coleofasciculus sp. E2-BRE-01 TaxID=3069524 RepID=UPI0032FA65BC
MDQQEFTNAFTKLTPRQKEVLQQFVAGKNDGEIAAELCISQGTVRKHIQNICQIFALNNDEDKGSSHRSKLITAIAHNLPNLIPGDTLAATNQPQVILSYHCGTDPDKSLAIQIETALTTQGCQVFIANGSLRMATQGLQQIYAELNRCDRVVLLLSPLAASSEMVTEEVQWAKRRRDQHPEGKPDILTIRINCPWTLLNHDLRGYLKGVSQQEWRSPEDTPIVLNLVRDWLSTDQPTTKTNADQKSSTFPSPYSLTPNHPPQPVAEPELPRGQVELASAFYVERPGVEQRCYEAVAKPGSLIRIKAPRQMGKTSLMARILHRGTQLNYATVPLSFQLADSNVFTNLDRFLQWFCAVITLELELPDRLDKYWSQTFGSKVSCKSYFERYLLATIATPLVLGLDEVDRVFHYPELTADFFGLLRSWHEEAKNREIWRKLRLVVVHSTEAYIPMDINQSPFNVGLPIDLPEFAAAQVQDLAQRHGLAWESNQVEQLMAMVGGHPYLVRLALYAIARQEITLAQLLTTAPTDAGLYGDHLRRHLWNLSQHPELATALKKVVTANSPIQLEPMQGFKLHSMGLVNLQGNEVTPRCDLYCQYFRLRLNRVHDS